MLVIFENAQNYGDKPSWPPCVHASVLSRDDVLQAVLAALDRDIRQVVLYSNSSLLLGYVESASLLYEEKIQVEDHRC